jgi:hypothetical protein
MLANDLQRAAIVADALSHGRIVTHARAPVSQIRCDVLNPCGKAVGADVRRREQRRCREQREQHAPPVGNGIKDEVRQQRAEHDVAGAPDHDEEHVVGEERRQRDVRCTDRGLARIAREQQQQVGSHCHEQPVSD